jgi:choline dehydrogenase-like flavoprotein/UDP-2,3-diacylglucosamine pyrophosphatase LpxH
MTSDLDIAERVGQPETVLVVSDLHLGIGQDPETGRSHRRENFFADAAFGEFLAAHAPEREGQKLLVVNGDAFDFLRVAHVPETDAEFDAWSATLTELGAQPPSGLRTLTKKERRYGLGTEDYKSVWKLTRIAQGHRAFFAALGRWVEQGGAIVFVKGNHDLELFWPLVQAALRCEIARAHPDAPVAERVLFCQDSLQLANVYVEHGHRFERTTAVMGPPRLPDNPNQLNLPLGSFVNRYVINSLEGLEPFLDNIKPVNRLLWTIVRRHPLKALTIARHSLTFLKRAAKRYWARDLLGFMLFFGSIILQALFIIALPLLLWPAFRHFLADLYAPLRYGAGVVALFGPYIAGFLRDLLPKRRPSVGEDVFAEGIYGALSRLGFSAAYPRVYGVMGHTHEPDVQQLPAIGRAAALYLNSGTWVAVWDVDRPDLTGTVIHSFIRFTREPGGFYKHEHLEWQVAARRATENIILDRGLPRGPGGFFSRRERRTVAAFAEVFIEGQDEVLTPAEIAANLDAHLLRVRSKRKGSLRLVLFVIEYLLPLLSLRGPFSRLSPATRRRIIERHLAGPRASRLGRNLAKIRALFCIGYYGDPRVFDSIHFALPAQQPRYRPGDLQPLPNRPPVPIAPPASGESVIEADVCVVGSGAGGAVVAYHAAAAGLRVVVLEEGRYVRTPELAHDEPVMSAMLYKESGLQATVDLGMTILQGRVLGGTTVINNAICFRIGDPALTPGRRTLEDWAALGAVVDRARLDASYDAVEEMIRVRPLPETLAPAALADGHTPGGANGDLLLGGWRALVAQGLADRAFKNDLFRLNYTQCLACGYCNFGCPYDRRMAMLETYLPQAAARGARLIPECHAVKIETRGGRAYGVRGEMADGRTLYVRAGTVVVAAGAIGSTMLLLKSGIKHNVGTRFSCNIATPMLARFPRRLAAHEALPMTAYIDAGEFLLESTVNPPLAFAVMLPGWFKKHFDRMGAYDRFTTDGVVLGSAPVGRIKRSRFLRDLLGPVDFRLSAADLATLKRGMALLAQVHFAAGAEAVFPGTFLDHEMTAERFAPGGRVDKAGIERYIAEIVQRPEDLTLNTAHPQGGNPMSDRPGVGAVDSSFRVHGFANLFVCDASVFPTSVAINPQLTIMAMADYAWRHCISRAPAGVA